MRSPVGVIDIGSNSIRLVVFDAIDAAPLPLFNDKVMCGLGRSLRRTGRLDVEGKTLALAHLQRFVRLAESIPVTRLEMLATAAVREAEDGPAFVAAIAETCGREPAILTGAEEARLAAEGVLAGIPDAVGVAGDLGGGSLELVPLADRRAGVGSSLPLGPLRLMETHPGDRSAAKKAIDAVLAQAGWPREAQGGTFYAVGGAWRSIARAHMTETGYPLRVIHRYRLPRDTAHAYARGISKMDPAALEALPGVSRRRLPALPMAALVLQRTLKALRPDWVEFCAFGLREGLLRALLRRSRSADPLLLAAAKVGRVWSRFGDPGAALEEWTAALFGDGGDSLVRLQRATCHLADIGWLEHPDHRAEIVGRRIATLPLPGIDHEGRAFMAQALVARYGADPALTETATAHVRGLLPAPLVARAEAFGAALRLAFALCGGAPSRLAGTALGRDADGAIVLRLTADGTLIAGDSIERRLAALVKAAGAPDGRIVTG